MHQRMKQSDAFVFLTCLYKNLDAVFDSIAKAIMFKKINHVFIIQPEDEISRKNNTG